MMMMTVVVVVVIPVCVRTICCTCMRVCTYLEGLLVGGGEAAQVVEGRGRPWLV
jgi:hypothetical protein